MEKVNKTELKNFAIQSRIKLIEQVKTKALMYGIDEKNELEIQEQFGQLMINDKPYPLYMKPAFNSLKNQLKQKGYKQLVEEVAYTWFNRIIAIRYMEIHDYLPEKVNVLSSNVGRVDPDILFEYETMDLPIKQEEIRELLDAGDTEGAYRKLFIAQCNTLNSILPFLFEQIQDYTELLLPDFLLDAESVIKVLVQNDELTNSFDEIEVIGWLYQYYIVEEKDRVFSQKSKYKKEEIPFATQLFTPKWIVQYMVQNSLGRYWTEAHQEDEDLISNWEYFIKHREENFQEKIAPYVNKELRVEDIKLLDPAMGSGHILVYAFEVFHQIYEKCGYPERDIPRLIIENNLYGLDIDDRAYQLAAFAVVMKASSYSRRFLRSVEREGINLNLASIQETNHISNDVIAYISQEEGGNRYNKIKAFFNQYMNAKTYGSLINITERDLTFIEERLEHIQNNPVEDLFYGEQHDIAIEVLPALVQQTKIMRNKYDVLVMNPPYMGSGSMSKELGDFLKLKYPASKSDLYAAFMEIDFYMKPNSLYGAINQQSWMFVSTYNTLREKIIHNKTIDSMIHLGARAFPEISGEVVQSTSFVLRNTKVDNLIGLYIRAVDCLSSEKKREYLLESIKLNRIYSIEQLEFLEIPSHPIAYWVTQNFKENFKRGVFAKEFCDALVSGNKTAKNELFLRYFWEVRNDSIGEKWHKYAKGGQFRKWYGNNEFVIDWSKEAHQFYKKNSSSSVIDKELWFKQGITYTDLTSKSFNSRLLTEDMLFDMSGPGLIIQNEENLKYLMGILNSKVANEYFKTLNTTFHYKLNDVNRIPIIVEDNIYKDIIKLVNENIEICKKDWDQYEVSPDFLINPLILKGEEKIENAFKLLMDEKSAEIRKLYNNEVEINRLIIKEYKLENEITSEVHKDEISIEEINRLKQVKELFSYFIGCVTGRYSLDEKGIINSESKFKPNPNGMIQLTESLYFENDIILRLREFLSAAFSPDTIDENIQWLADTLVMKKGEDSESRLRRYFFEEFFENHCSMFQKRPIYWLVDSGKQKGLRTLIYMHKYQPDTMATIRFEHLQEIQAKYQNEITDLENRLVNPNISASEKKKLTAEKTSFEKKMDELREFDKRLAEIANEEIEIDLDDGVKVNYEKFYRGGKGVLAKIK